MRRALGVMIVAVAAAWGSVTAGAADEAQSAVAASQAELAWKLIEGTPPGRDAVVSPASLASAFYVLTEGADARMKASISKAIALGGAPPAEAEALIASARKTLAAADPEAFVAADRLVFPPAAAPSAAIVARLDHERISHVTADVSKPAGVAAVNDWVASVTKGMIPKLIDAPLPAPQFVALDALYFKGKWAEPFDPKRTSAAPFHETDGSTRTAMLMHLPAERRLFRVDGPFVAVELPFAGDRYELVVVVSTDRPRALKDFAPAQGWLAGDGFASDQGDVALPRFTLEDEENLLPKLAADLADGMKSPTAFAAFGAGSKIDAILQGAKIEVDEEGARAAAVTGIMVTAAALPPLNPIHMVVDKPYLFALRDRESGLLLIAGYVAEAPKQRT